MHVPTKARDNGRKAGGKGVVKRWWETRETERGKEGKRERGGGGEGKEGKRGRGRKNFTKTLKHVSNSRKRTGTKARVGESLGAERASAGIVWLAIV